MVDGQGWFVVNAREARWKDEGPLGSDCNFEGKRRFPHFGINVSVLEPGERVGMYHREKAQEAFLVLSGECTLIVEGKERQLVAWDFFYCPPETEHIIVAAAEQSAILLAVGARGRGVAGGLVYTVCKAAARYGASVVRETRDPLLPTPRSGQNYLGLGSSSTAPRGYQRTTERPLARVCSPLTPREASRRPHHRDPWTLKPRCYRRGGRVLLGAQTRSRIPQLQDLGRRI